MMQLPRQLQPLFDVFLRLRPSGSGLQAAPRVKSLAVLLSQPCCRASAC